PFAISSSLTMSSISRNDASGEMPLASYVANAPSESREGWRQTWRVRSIGFLPSAFCLLPSLVAPRRELHFLVSQRLFLQPRLAVLPRVLPRRDIEIFVVVALRFA